MKVLALNAGSSSLKYRLFEMLGSQEGMCADTLLASGQVEKIGQEKPLFRFQFGGSAGEQELQDAPGHAECCRTALRLLVQNRLLPHMLAHRVVHGGEQFTQTTLLTPEVRQQLESLSELAPLHNPPALACMDAAAEVLGSLPGAACFDTAFHSAMPPEAYSYALPQQTVQQFSARRYGFHGISYQYILQQLLQAMNRPAEGTRLILCHLGAGASICAVLNGRSVDTSMGYTPLAGLVMATRSGDLDPGLLLCMLGRGGCTVTQMEYMLNHESGLRALSGGTADVQTLEKLAQEGSARAAFALEVFARSVKKTIGAYAAVLGGADAVCFTGGIGEHDAAMRTRICRGMNWMGLTLDETANHASLSDTPLQIHAAGSGCQIWAAPTNEEKQMAYEAWRLIQQH